jgi:8-oxo-dGTP diphosphatase
LFPEIEVNIVRQDENLFLLGFAEDIPVEIEVKASQEKIDEIIDVCYQFETDVYNTPRAFPDENGDDRQKYIKYTWIADFLNNYNPKGGGRMADNGDCEVRTYALGTLSGYDFVVVFARYEDKWLYARHRERDTWETAGGHIEPGETPMEAATRELHEETGAQLYSTEAAFDYSVTVGTRTTNGRVFYSEIDYLDDMPDFEMREVGRFDDFPDEMTYPEILPVLFAKIAEWRSREH